MKSNLNSHESIGIHINTAGPAQKSSSLAADLTGDLLCKWTAKPLLHERSVFRLPSPHPHPHYYLSPHPHPHYFPLSIRWLNRQGGQIWQERKNSFLDDLSFIDSTQPHWRVLNLLPKEWTSKSYSLGKDFLIEPLKRWLIAMQKLLCTILQIDFQLKCLLPS